MQGCARGSWVRPHATTHQGDLIMAKEDDSFREETTVRVCSDFNAPTLDRFRGRESQCEKREEGKKRFTEEPIAEGCIGAERGVGLGWQGRGRPCFPFQI